MDTKAVLSTPPTTGPTPNSSSRPAEPRSPSWRRQLLPLFRQYLTHSDRPILVGPFRGEIGFEALYWIPFVQQLAHTLKIPLARLIPISRGGAAEWYGTPQGLELYAMRDPQAVRVENRMAVAQHAMLKQMRVSAFDTQVLRDAAETLRLGKYQVLHPSWMYQTLEPFWQEHKGLAWLQPYLRMEQIQAAPLASTIALPEKFVAVRFYARQTFPFHETTLQFARETIKQLSAQVPVVLLNSGLHMDDHLDLDFKILPANVIRLTDLVPLLPERNLAIQASVLSRALGFVGTYGGLAQLALRLHKPVISVYTQWAGTALAHVHLSQALALQLGLPFKVLGLHELPLIQDAMPRIVVQPPQIVKKDLTPIASCLTVGTAQ